VPVGRGAVFCVALPPGVRSFGRGYCGALEAWPLRTKALTSALLFACGDVAAQVMAGLPAAGSSVPFSVRLLAFDGLRLLKYALTGIGYGVIWSYWWVPAAPE
jgi:hypothetical protein